MSYPPDVSEHCSNLGFADLAAMLDKALDLIKAAGVAKWHPLALGAILSVLALVLAFPQYRAFSSVPSELLWVAEAVEWKFAHPLLPIPVDEFAKDARPGQSGIVEHLGKKSYRIAVPLISNLLGIGVKGAIILQQIGAVLFLSVMLLLLRRITNDETVTLLGGLYVAATFLGQIGFNDFDNFDGIACLTLLLAVWSRSFIVIFLAILFGGFTDERVIIATPLIYLCHSILPSSTAVAQTTKSWLRLILPGRLHWAVISGVFAVGVGRIYLGYLWGAYVDTTGFSTVVVNIHLILFPLTALNLVKGGVFVFATLLLVASAKREIPAIIWTAVAMVPIVATSIFVYDFTKSLTYAFPAFFIAMVLVVRNVHAAEVQRLMSVAVICSILFPTYFTVFGQIHPLLPILRIF
jgi:hypothetical protein